MNDVVSESIRIFVRKIDEAVSNVDKLFEMFPPIIQNEASIRLDRRRLQQLPMEGQGLVSREVQRSEKEINQILNRMNTTTKEQPFHIE